MGVDSWPYRARDKVVDKFGERFLGLFKARQINSVVRKSRIQEFLALKGLWLISEFRSRGPAGRNFEQWGATAR